MYLLRLRPASVPLTERRLHRTADVRPRDSWATATSRTNEDVVVVIVLLRVSRLPGTRATRPIIASRARRILQP
ncbi:hypothetical protein NDU88_010573 [Pleurodeles waltl]|uniref:Uncharacterized protein n=1 Tax=Pleurodeles waltl TaxID=8319 RepID=A0AAV7RZE6_PLEWA|nr:hypothetical protein NDU88_010573 [Pleurodeles waltl]